MDKYKYFRIFITYLLLSWVWNVQGQDDLSKEIKIKSKYEIAGDSCFNIKQINIKGALDNYKKAAAEYASQSDYSNHVKMLVYQSTIFYNLKDQIQFSKLANEAYSLASQHLSKTNVQYFKALNEFNRYHYSIGNYNKSVYFLKQIIDFIKDSNDNTTRLNSLQVSLANSYRFSGDSDNALIYLNKAIQNETAYNRSLNLLAIENTAKTQFFLSDTKSDSSIHYNKIRKSLSLNINNSINLLVNAYKSKAQLFHAENKLDSSIQNYISGESLLKDVKSKNKKANYYLNFADVLVDQNLNKQALKYLNLAEKTTKLKSYKLVQFLEIQGKLLSKQGNSDLAINAFIKASEVASISNERNTPIFKAKRFLTLGVESDKLKRNEQTLEFIKQGLQAISNEFDPIDVYSNPDISTLVNKAEALDLLNLKGNVLHRAYKDDPKNHLLVAANESYYLGANLVRDIRNEIFTSESKKTLQQKAIDIFDKGIETSFILYNLDKNAIFLRRAYYLIENNKALTLFEQLKEKLAKGHSAIPDTLIEQEQELNLNIKKFEKSLVECQVSNQSCDDVKLRLLDLKILKDEVRSKLERDYPEYHRLKYENQPIAFQEVLTSIADRASLFLEYYVGKESTYVVAIGENKSDFYNIGRTDSIYIHVASLMECLRQPPGAKPSLDEYQQFSLSASSLYQYLLAPVVDSKSANINSLTILPDEFLNFIPFEILLENYKSNPSYSTKHLEYLLEKYAINYQYSITFALAQKKIIDRKFENDFVGFAPKFNDLKSAENRSCDDENLFELKGSADELAKISSMLNGQKFIDEDAVVLNFNAYKNRTKILHLATHACLDKENSALSKIHFTDDHISSMDLENIEINTLLTVLSACNTGSGEFIKGEGVMSLARSFISSGSESTVMSMWSVDDMATSDIMVDFYSNLKLGLPKDQALKNAKLNYLNIVTPSKLHPYYWAAFVLSGDVAEISFSQTSFLQSLSFQYLILGVILLGAFILLAYKYFRART